MVEFGDSLSWTYVMGGLAREYVPGHAASAEPVYLRLVSHWLDVAERGGMPSDPRLWTEGPVTSTYPACMAVKAASEQAEDAEYAYLRALREGLFCFRRKLDTTEALVEEARAAKLNVERFRIDLGSHAIVEAFGEDLEETRTAHDGEPVQLPSAIFVGEDGSRHPVLGPRPYDDYAAAAEAAGATRNDERPSIEQALRRFGRMATREIEAVCGLPEPRAQAELWRMASEWQAKPTRVLTGHLWEPA